MFSFAFTSIRWYLLKVISVGLAQTMRTMFQFLSGDSSDGEQTRTKFQMVYKNYSNDQNKWNYLTADSIWIISLHLTMLIWMKHQKV
jgi:hypothetical protein